LVDKREKMGAYERKRVVAALVSLVQFSERFKAGASKAH